jgi:uncharacterized membrane protein
MKLAQLHREATDHLKTNKKSFSKLVLIHSAIAVGVTFLLIPITWLAQNAGSDSSIGSAENQILLTTLQWMLQFVAVLGIPFWNAGLSFCALRTLQGKDNSSHTLLEGFRCWSPIGTSLLIQGLNYWLLTMINSLIPSAFLSTIPLPLSFQEALLAYAEKPVFPPPDNILLFFKVYFVIYCICLPILLVPRLYLHRLIPYKIMDGDEACNGLQAVLYSRILMKGKRRKLLLLDLSFWWFYLLEMCISGIAMADVILAAMGIALPIGSEITFWLFPVVALLLRLVLYYLAKPKLAITYALFFRKIMDAPPTEPKPPKPKRMPWKY